MALLNKYYLSLDIKKRMAAILPIFRQGDTGGVLTFRIFDNGILFDLSDYTRSELLFILPDGTTYLGTASLSDGIITYNITGIELSKPGDVKVIMSLYSNSSVISVQPFKIGVYDNLRDEEINNISILQDLIAEVTLTTQNAGNEIQRQNNENQRILDENNRLANEVVRVANEQGRVANEQGRVELSNQLTTTLNNLDFLGDYDSSKTYNRFNVVYFQGSSFIALKQNLNITPNDNNIDWTLLSLAGRNGQGTVNSVNGIEPDVNGHLILPIRETIVTDSLESSSILEALSANRGRELKENADSLLERVSTDNIHRGVDITTLGAVGGDVTADTQALLNAFANYNSIFIPEGNFIINSTIKWKSGTKLYGVNKRSILTFVGEGDFIVADSSIDSQTSFNFSLIDGVRISGNRSLGVVQNGINLNGFSSSIRNTRIENFSGIGINAAGVSLLFEQLYVAVNNIGMNIKDLFPNVHSTLFNIKDSNFNYNTLGITNRNNGQSLNENIIHLNLEMNVFERNERHFDLRPFDASMVNCWLESGGQPSITWDFRWYMNNNRINAGDPGIEYQASTGNFNGSVEVRNNGSIAAKNFDFSFYGSSGLNSGQLEISEDLSDVGNIRYLKLTNSSTGKSSLLSETFSKNYRISYPIVIDSNGSILRNSYSSAGYTVTVTRLRTGVYQVDLGSAIDILPTIEVMSPTSTGDPASFTVPTYYHTLRTQNDLGNADYNNFNLTKRLIIHTFSRTVNESGQITDVVADARINIIIHSARR